MAEKLPIFLEGEHLIIGHLLAHPEIIDEVSKSLPVDAFSDKKCKIVYGGIVNNVGLEFGLLLQRLKELTDDEDIAVSLEEYVRSIEEEVPFSSYVDKLNEYYLRRNFIASSQQALSKAFDLSIPIQEIASQLIVSVLDDKFEKDTIVKSENLWKRRVTGLQNRSLKGRVLLGYPSVDQFITEGFAPKTQSVIAGRPSMGKSTLKRCLICRLCDRGLGVFNVIPEMGFDREHDCIDAVRTGRPIKDFYNVSSWDETFKAEIKASNQYIQEKWNYTAQEERFYSFNQFERDLLSLTQTKEIDVVFIDLFDRLTEVSSAKGSEKTYVVKQILQRQAALASKLNLHICNIVQISRFDKGKTGKKKHIPTMSDLAESGAFEQISDLILLLYRESYYDESVPDEDVDVILAKQRVGPRNKTIKLPADWERLTIEDFG